MNSVNERGREGGGFVQKVPQCADVSPESLQRDWNQRREGDGKIVINRCFFMTEERERREGGREGERGSFLLGGQTLRRLRLKPIKWRVEPNGKEKGTD